MIIPFLLISLFLFFLLFPNQTLDASSYGLILWFDTLLPTLLPFLIISQLILKTSAVTFLQRITAPIIKKIFHCSEYGVFCILCGFLCGYPVGARLIVLALEEDRMNLSEAQYLLSFCNNVSPVFCISYGILHAINSQKIVPFLLFVYGSSLLFGFINRPKKIPETLPLLQEKKQTPATENLFQLIDVCIIDSFLIMIKLCGYLILFSIISKGFLLLLPENNYIRAVFMAFLELTGGLSAVTLLPEGLFRQAIGVTALSFGGICCIFQTNSIICRTALSLKKYLAHKAFISAITLFFFLLWNFFLLTINGWS